MEHHEMPELVLEDVDSVKDVDTGIAAGSSARPARRSKVDHSAFHSTRASMKARASQRRSVMNALVTPVWTDVIPGERQAGSQLSHQVTLNSSEGLVSSSALTVFGEKSASTLRRSGAQDLDPDCAYDQHAHRSLKRHRRMNEPRFTVRARGSAARGQEVKPVFADAAAMKKKLREAILKPKHSVFDYYKKEGLFQFLARHQIFEAITLFIIAVNAVYMAVDADYNKSELLSEADWPFQVAEHFFCSYFLIEWCIRFMAFEVKANGLKDPWFVFDSGLIALSVTETWVISLCMTMVADEHNKSNVLPTPMLRLLRLLRLMRMARMAKILKELPELMILIKGMSMATRSVLFTCCLLIILIYVFAIAFTGLLRNTEAGRLHFDDVVTSMVTLALYGTLLDEITSVAYVVGEESLLCSFLLGFFILVAALTVMNMLIGVLCEVVNAVAAVERDELVVCRLHDQLKQLFDEQGLDMNGDGHIDRSEFEKILEIPQAARLLQDVGVDVVGLVDFAEVIFEGDPCSDEPERQLSFPAFMEVVLQLRGGNTATVKDIVDMRKSIMQHNERLVDNLYASMLDSGMYHVDHHEDDDHHHDHHDDATRRHGRVQGTVQHGIRSRISQDSQATPSGVTGSTLGSDMVHVTELRVVPRHSQTSSSEDDKSRLSAPPVTLNVPQEMEDTGGTKDLRSVEDLLTNGLQEIQRIQAKSLSLEESLSAGLNELRAVRRRTEGLQDVFVRGLNEVRRAR